MQEYLAEISGTLARKQQRKNTVLSHIYKQAQHAKRAEQFGFSVRPDDPNLVTDAKAAKHFLNEVRGEIGHHVARMHNPQLVSIEKDGEVVVRQLNNSIFRLTLTRNRWLDRCAQLGVPLTDEEEAVVEAHRRGDRVRKVYYGCAAELPEAKEQRRRREEIQAARTAQQRDREIRKRHRQGDDEKGSGGSDESDGESETDDEESGGVADGERAGAPLVALQPSIRDDPNVFAGDVAAYLAAVKAAVEATLGEGAASTETGSHDATLMLRREEAKAEEVLRRQAAAAASADAVNKDTAETEPQSAPLVAEFVYDYCPVGCDAPNIPTDEELRRTLLEQRKAAMKAQLAAMSKR